MCTGIKLSKKEALEKGWATIGGRADDYLDVLKHAGRAAALSQIAEVYDVDDVASVFRGVLVLHLFGPSVYYSGRF